MNKFFKGKDKKVDLSKPKEPRASKEIEQELDQITRGIGKLHHQRVCIEAQITQQTNFMHQTLLEYDQALRKENPDVNLENLKDQAP